MPWMRAMTDASGGPPDKRKRRPGQEAASRGKAKVNSGDNATNSTGSPNCYDTAAGVFDGNRLLIPRYPRRSENLHAIYPKLFPEGGVNGGKLRLGSIEIDLKDNPGRFYDASTRQRGKWLVDLALALDRDANELWERYEEIWTEIVTSKKRSCWRHCQYSRRL